MTAGQRFWAKVDKTDGCWLWTAGVTKDGYGLFNPSAGIGMVAHRWAYQHLVGDIPAGLQLDHLCRVPACVNPAHMEPVTPGENVRRSTSAEANRRRAAEQTHCRNDHAFTPDNTYIFGSKRGCRTCRQDAVLRYRARKATA